MLRCLYSIACLLLVGSLNAQTIHLRTKQSLKKEIDNSLQKAVANYKVLAQQLTAGRFPVSFNTATKTLRTSGSEPWVGGFYPGALLYLYEATKDSALYNEAMQKLSEMEKEKHNTTTHDLGFMMYCSFGNAYRLASDDSARARYKEVIVTSAQSLASRFNEKVGCIKSWDSRPDQFMVIIDNMMNLELLFAATRFTGDSSFYRMAVTHANTTIVHHFRPDYSSHHLVIYDPKTGGVQKKQTVQGFADASSWARGQSWGLYGYTLLYRETKDKKYLDQAVHIADYMLQHLPADNVFYWDFMAPDKAPPHRDASATAITCSALLELQQYMKRKAGKKYLATALNMIQALSSPGYFAAPDECKGFILKHGVGNAPAKSDIDVPLIYSDYYYVEALMRCKQLLAK